MDLVLGLSITSTAVRWVLVEGATGEGATIDRGASDVASIDAVVDEIVAAGNNRIYAVGVAWTDQAEDAASVVLDALAAWGLENVIAVSELEAADVLASGIADIAAYEDAAVCVVEPDAAVIAVVRPDGVTVDRVDRPLDGEDAIELTSSVMANLDLDDWQPDAIFVVGSADDLDLIISTLEGVTASPVISAAEADLALARGAALASARAVNALEAQAAPTGRRWMSRMGALTSALVASVLTLVVSLSVALGLRLTPDSSPEQPQAANADQPARVASAPSVTQAVPQPARPAAPPPEAVFAKKIAVVAPPPAAAPIAPPPAAPTPAPAYVPPAPAYVPPAPNYVPPVAPEPRLRDRIIERIPIINRFHEPELQYPR